MSRANFQAFAVDAQGNILSGASVEVRNSSGALLAASAIFTGYTGAGTVSSNPFTVGSDGLIQFYVEGSQVVTITATSGTNSATWSNVVLNELFTPSDYATAAQGTKADTALQAADIANKADLVGGVIPNSQLPSLAITEYLGEAANQTALLALSGQRGDWAIRTDLGTTFILTNDGGSSISDWTEIATPADAVSSVNGNTGAVVLDASDVGAATAAQGALADSATQPADLGTAAAADLTTSSTDTASGRVLKVGDGGFLGFPQDVSDYSTPEAGLGRIFRESASTSGGDGSGFWGCISLPMAGNYASGSMQSAIVKANATELKFGRKLAGNSAPSFIDVWTTINYQPETSLGSGVSRKMKNKSGGAIADQAQVAGSSLKAVYTDSSGVEQESAVSVGGTWINVSGMSIGNNEAAEFVKI